MTHERAVFAAHAHTLTRTFSTHKINICCFALRGVGLAVVLRFCLVWCFALFRLDGAVKPRNNQNSIYDCDSFRIVFVCACLVADDMEVAMVAMVVVVAMVVMMI